ncbi:hypothetical protein WELLINGTON_288 [Erwinia phage Wellington]|jgi:hypothetical protein|uniref:Uncharacterized protein n=2 Tax=Wellingtonvirus wellington TaxID=2734153 RepID=A0A1B2IEG8_9CAUD|nr:hypothetical protein BIZ80_gp012 [Erwinia phage vB_EamM_Kwan]YP_009806772.1 hypothetical protein HOT70_gp013 [Erwinia phage Wellington]ANZ49639.1 hypothetical protein KWAN_287 [Erwinia phage vB_EamM_Kwan]AXF51414.1 hypothetical protein WELLINGTON_288 [Erwinia phage Wellington]
MSGELLRKVDWFDQMRKQEIKPEEQVKLWIQPHGCLCEIREVAGLPVLVNGEHHVLNSTFARTLFDAGIVGHVIIHTTESIPQNTAKWLTWWLSGDPAMDDEKVRTITVYTFSRRPKMALPFKVEVVEPILLQASNVKSTVGMQSRNLQVSLFVVERANGKRYSLEPQRYVTCTILACTQHGYVLCSDNNNVFLADKISRHVQAQLQNAKLRTDDLVGTRVKVQFTMYTDGQRLCNYKNPIVHRSSALDDMGALSNPAYDGPYLFKPSTQPRSAMLTSTRCTRARITLENEVICGRDAESGAILFTFRKGVEPGVYGAEMGIGGQVEHWRFESPYSVDALDPNGFVRVLEPLIYFATGYSLQRIGLHFADHTKQSLIA